MGWEDRPYYRDRRYSANPLSSLLSGSLPLFTAFGIRVRAHNALTLFIASELVLNWTKGYGLADRIISMSVMFVLILLHEYGHCAAARLVGGSADDIMLWPLGGLAMAHAPNRPGPQFWTVAAGPLVNVLIWVLSAATLRLLPQHIWVSLNPFHPPPFIYELSWTNPALYVGWIYYVNYLLLLFNLLPIYPMDNGQIVQIILWKFVGNYQSRLISCLIGMCGSALLGVFAVARWDSNSLLLLLLAAWLFHSCYQERMILRQTGPGEPWQTDDPDYSAGLYRDPEPARPRANKRAARIARLRAREDAADRQRLDAILVKVSAHGLASLTWRQRRTLRLATDQRRKRESELKSLFEE